VAVPTLKPHVTNERWCVFPKEDDGNEWLIINYMVAICPSIPLFSLLLPPAGAREDSLSDGLLLHRWGRCEEGHPRRTVE
jgi:hypothetical protein